MADRNAIVTYLDELLRPALYTDASKNGLQVDAGRSEVTRVAVAVDSGLSVVEEAVDKSADLLIVHHGLFWGSESTLTGAFGAKIRLLVQGGCSLYASHLPLDGNPEVGNAFELGRFLGVSDLAGFCHYGGMTIGARGALHSATVDSVAKACASMLGAGSPLILPFGRKQIDTVAIVTGSGSSALEDCSREGIDLLISGEPKQAAFHTCKELGLNAIFAGHYATETFGVRALLSRIQAAFSVEGIFIDQPTGI